MVRVRVRVRAVGEGRLEDGRAWLGLGLGLGPWVRAAWKTAERRPRIRAWAVKRTGGSSP